MRPPRARRAARAAYVVAAETARKRPDDECAQADAAEAWDDYMAAIYADEALAQDPGGRGTP